MAEGKNLLKRRRTLYLDKDPLGFLIGSYHHAVETDYAIALLGFQRYLAFKVSLVLFYNLLAIRDSE